MDSNRRDQVVFNQPKVFAERQDAARILVDRLKYRMPVAIDHMDNRADTAFAAWPERIYIIGADGRVLYKGGMGPFGFHPDEAGRKLGEVLQAMRVPARPAAAAGG